MATVHIAYVKPTLVDPIGNVVDKNTASISQVASSSLEMIVLADTTYAPNADGTQSIEEYLTAEYAAGFAIKYMDNTTIVTDTP